MEMLRFLVTRGREDVQKELIEENLVKKVAVEVLEPQWKW